MNATEEFKLSDYMPADFLMQLAWVDGVRWIIEDDEMLAFFQKETGCNWKAAASPLERMIDQATGADLEVFKRLLVWFNERIWGDLCIVAGGSEDSK